MKYVYRLIINYIIRNFKKISGSIVANNQPFVCIGFEHLLMKRMPHGIPNVGLCQAMFKGGFVELNIRKHTFYLPHMRLVSFWIPDIRASGSVSPVFASHT